MMYLVRGVTILSSWNAWNPPPQPCKPVKHAITFTFNPLQEGSDFCYWSFSLLCNNLKCLDKSEQCTDNTFNPRQVTNQLFQLSTDFKVPISFSWQTTHMIKVYKSRTDGNLFSNIRDWSSHGGYYIICCDNVCGLVEIPICLENLLPHHLPWKCRQHVPQNHWYLPAKLHGIKPQRHNSPCFINICDRLPLAEECWNMEYLWWSLEAE
jgi:hypothetical protein